MAKKARPLSVKKQIKELQHTVHVAGLNFDIWWTYKQRRSRRRFVDVLNRYPLFFQTSIHAHFVALVIAIYRLYETRKDTYNIPRLVAQLETEATLPKATLAGIRRRTTNAKPVWKKISILRNGAFGHRTEDGTYDDVLRRAKLTYDQIRQLIYHSQRLVNRISHVVERNSYAFNLDASEHTKYVLRDLDAYHRIVESRHRR